MTGIILPRDPDFDGYYWMVNEDGSKVLDDSKVIYGHSFLIYALAVCIIGGLGSWAGAVLASFVLGFAMIISTALFGALWESVVLVGAIIFILIFRPSGLLGKQKELEERV